MYAVYIVKHNNLYRLSISHLSGNDATQLEVPISKRLAYQLIDAFGPDILENMDV